MDNPSLNNPTQSLAGKQMRIEEYLVLIIVFTAGFVDVIAYLNWKTYVSLMSGNTTQLGIYINKDSTTNVMLLSVTALVVFVLGICIGTIYSIWRKEKARTSSLLIVAGIYALYVVLINTITIPPIISISFFGFGIGFLNTVIVSEGPIKLNSVFITGALVNVATSFATFVTSKDKAERKDAVENVFRFFFIWMGFLLGTFAGSSVFDDFGSYIMLVPVGLVLICAFIVRYYCGTKPNLTE